MKSPSHGNANPEPTPIQPANTIIDQRLKQIKLAHQWTITNNRAARQWNKCFGIGCNKTGTTSLEQVIRYHLGYRSDQTTVEYNASVKAILGDYKPFLKAMRVRDFHQDMPISQGIVFAAIDGIFPNSKFILTLREPHQWALSFSKFYAPWIADLLINTPREKRASYLFPGYIDQWLLNRYWKPELEILRQDLAGNKEKKTRKEWIQDIPTSTEFRSACALKFQARNDLIQDYFSSRPNDLLVIDLSKEKTISKITRFLNLPDYLIAPIPHVRPGQHTPTKEELLSWSFQGVAGSIQ